MKRNLLIVGLSLLLGACGFQLRGTDDTNFALRELDLQARDAYGDLVKDLRRALENRGIQVHAGAPYRLVLVSERETQRAVSYTHSARSAEYQLSVTLQYQIQDAGKLQLLSNKLEVQNVYSQDENNLIGSDQEAAQMRNEMRRELIQQLLQQLQVITPERLDTLQREAEEKARAEAEALEAARRLQDSTPQQSPLQLPIQNP